MFRLSSAVSMSTDCIVITDFDAKIIDVNQKTLEMYGADSKEELVGKHFLELIIPAEREMVNTDVKEIIEKGYLECREYKIISKQGREFPTQMSTSLVRDADGKPMGMVRVGRELS
jgi:two-component system NtrC family sensor kinase